MDIRDAVGDRLYLSDSFRRDGTLFDIGQATALKEHAAVLSARQAIAQSRKSRGLFATLLRKNTDGYRPTYNFTPAGNACRIYGSVFVKKVTGKVVLVWRFSLAADALSQLTYISPPRATDTPANNM